MSAKIFLRCLLFITLTIGLAGCDNDNGNSANNTSTSSQQQRPPTVTDENDFVTFVRTAPPEVRVNEDFTVKIVVTAKRSFELMAASDTLPTGMVEVSPTRTSFIANAEPDQILEFEYRARITRPGTYQIRGHARALVSAGESSQSLELVSTITAR